MEKISEKIDVHKLQTSELQIFWAIDNLSTDLEDRFTLADVLTYLVEKVGININQKTALKALQRAKNDIHKNKKGYKLMEHAKKKLGKNIDNAVIVIEPGKPFTTKAVEVASVMGTLVGEVKICDPYIDSSTLDFLSKWIKSGVIVKILTQNIVEKTTGMFKRNLQELSKEGYLFEIRVIGNNCIHDRYIIDSKKMWMSGNSLNHLGQKESFIVRLGEDIRQANNSLFDTRWKSAVLFN